MIYLVALKLGTLILNIYQIIQFSQKQMTWKGENVKATDTV